MFVSKLTCSCFSAVISDDEHGKSHEHNPIEHEDIPHGSRTPPTPPDRSPPPTSPLSWRVRAVAHLQWTRR